jgi:hypothetical protein
MRVRRQNIAKPKPMFLIGSVISFVTIYGNIYVWTVYVADLINEINLFVALFLSLGFKLAGYALVVYLLLKLERKLADET